MEYIDIDHQVYDVPDTPDREASNDKRNNGRVEIEINSSPSARSKKKSRIFGEGFRNQARGKSKLYIDDGLNKRLSFDPIRDPGISKATNGNGGLSSSLTNLSTFKNANPFRKTVNPGNQHSLNFQHKEKGRENAVVDLTKSNGRAQAFELSSSQDNGHSTFAPDNYKGKEKIEFQGSSGANDSPPPRVHEVKRVVKNGDVSPLSLANGKHIAENNSKGSVPVQKNVRSNVSDCTLDDLDLMRELVSDDNNLRRGKRQKINISLPKDVDIRSMSSRPFIAPARDVTENSSSVRDALKSFDAIGGWRNTHTLKANPVFSVEEKNNNPQNERIDLRRLNRIGTSPSSSTLVKKRKLGESSSSRSPDSDKVVIGSSQKAPNVRTGRNINKNGVGTSSSFIEIDELSPDMRCGDSANRESSGNNDSYAKAMQLEADEMLALELQEQMYSEMSQVGNPEIDEYIALAMQEEETSEHVSASTSLPVFRPRERGPSNVNRRSRFRSSQIPLARSTTRARNFPPSRLTRLRSQVSGRSPRVPVGLRNPDFPPGMDLDMRMHILEALEDMGVANSDFQVDRDFNENDYEMLLGLDENNHRHAGASVHTINRLPQSTVQNGNSEDCAICLETPSMGDVLRILPCLHKFHKDCIDPWLRRNTSCPVCKSSVT